MDILCKNAFKQFFRIFFYLLFSIHLFFVYCILQGKLKMKGKKKQCFYVFLQWTSEFMKPTYLFSHMSKINIDSFQLIHISTKTQEQMTWLNYMKKNSFSRVIWIYILQIQFHDQEQWKLKQIEISVIQNVEISLLWAIPFGNSTFTIKQTKKRIKM